MGFGLGFSKPFGLKDFGGLSDRDLELLGVEVVILATKSS
jgi:hypothetical protein